MNWTGRGRRQAKNGIGATEVDRKIMARNDRQEPSGSFEIPLLSGQPGRLLLRPWFDRVTIHWVTRWFFPMSRGWAAARAARGSRDRFYEQIGRNNFPAALVDRLLEAMVGADERYQEAYREWLRQLFENRDATQAELARAEDRREKAAQAFMAVRAHVFPLRLTRNLPPVAYDIVAPETLERAHGYRLAGTGAAFPAPDSPGIVESNRIQGEQGVLSWLRWPSRMGDTAWARVYAPKQVKDPPTLIYLHGVGMETEMWQMQSDPLDRRAHSDGLRIVRPEGPWHGRRMLFGYHGGEPVFAFAPKGYIDLTQAWVSEIAQLIEWARATSRGPVAIGGLSLGALTAQVVATAARVWPQRLHPDAMFLVATSGDVVDVSFSGSLAKGLGLMDALQAGGWTEENLKPWRKLLEPQGPPVMPAERIVMLLGANDTVTPFAGGLALAREWGLPDENLFVRDQGHFSTPLGLNQDDAPIRRLVAILKDMMP